MRPAVIQAKFGVDCSTIGRFDHGVAMACQLVAETDRGDAAGNGPSLGRIEGGVARGAGAVLGLMPFECPPDRLVPLGASLQARQPVGQLRI